MKVCEHKKKEITCTQTKIVEPFKYIYLMPLTIYHLPFISLSYEPWPRVIHLGATETTVLPQSVIHLRLRMFNYTEHCP